MLFIPVCGPQQSGKSSFVKAVAASGYEAKILPDPDRRRSIEAWQVHMTQGRTELSVIVLNPPPNRPFKVTNLIRLLEKYKHCIVVFEWDFTRVHWHRLSVLFRDQRFLMAYCNTPLDTCQNRVSVNNAMLKKPKHLDPLSFARNYKKMGKELEQAVADDDLWVCEVTHGLPAEAQVAKLKEYMAIAKGLIKTKNLI